jgi:DNA-binding transcriptional LysR family regulator
MLFDRRARSAKLTPAGKALFADLQKIAPAFDEMLSRVGLLRTEAYRLLPHTSALRLNSMVSQFTKNNPTISVDVRRERDYRRAFALLASGNWIFFSCIVPGPPIPVHGSPAVRRLPVRGHAPRPPFGEEAGGAVP